MSITLTRKTTQAESPRTALRAIMAGTVTGTLLLTAISLTSHVVVQAQYAAWNYAVSTAHAAINTAAERLGYAKLIPPPDELTIHEMLEREALRHRIAPGLIRAISSVESQGEQFATSKAGAIGVMQVMPANATYCGLKHFGALYDPTANIPCGCKIYAEARDQRAGVVELALAQYNAGAKRVNEAIKAAGSKEWHKIAPHLPLETQKYVGKVLKAWSEDLRG